MYEVGSLILYGRNGVCRVEEIKENEVSGQRQLFYVLKPLYQNCNITIAVDNTKVFFRPIISRDEAHSLIDKMPEIRAEPYHNRNLTQLREYYKNWLDSHECIRIVEMTKSLYAKRCEAEREKRKFGAVDERFLKEAEELLFGEFAAALEIEKSEVLDYITSRIGTTV